MKIKTQTLTGAALDWAVAKCEGLTQGQIAQDAVNHGFYNPSRNWAQGGPIIEREGIMLEQWKTTGHWQAATELVPKVFTAETPLIAAMRCYVASKLGDEVEVPDEVAA